MTKKTPQPKDELALIDICEKNNIRLGLNTSFIHDMLAFLADHDRQLLERIEAKIIGETKPIKVPYNLYELQKAYENGASMLRDKQRTALAELRKELEL